MALLEYGNQFKLTDFDADTNDNQNHAITVKEGDTTCLSASRNELELNVPTGSALRLYSSLSGIAEMV